MPIRSPSRSIFRPKDGVDSGVVERYKPIVEAIDRRSLLRGSFSLGALSMLTGCSVTDTAPVESFMSAVSAFNDKVQELMFRPNHLAPTFREDQVVKPPRFNAYYDIEDVNPVDGKTWKLEVAGLVDNKASWTSQQIGALPEQEIIVRHICVEGWDYIGQWSGVNFGQFLERIGADRRAKYVAFKCADDYTECLDMATALHPQTQMTFKYDGEILPPKYGFPMKVRIPTKLGFKNPKHVMEMAVINNWNPGYWEEQGYNWFSGN